MGRQINFYMTESDEREFIKFLRTDDDTRIVRDRTTTPELELLTALPDRDRQWGFKVWLWNAGTSPAPSVDFVQAQNVYCLDPLSNEIIEFSRSRIDDGRLVRGRLWVEFSGWDRKDPAATIRKSDGFKKWYSRLSDWIKRRSTRNAVGDYLMTDAAKYVERGGRTAQAVSASGNSV